MLQTDNRRELASESPPSGGEENALHVPPGRKRTRWFRPFFNLRWRLAFVYVALFGIFVAILSGLIYSSANALIYGNGQMAFPQRVTQLRQQFLRDICNNQTLVNTDNFIEQGDMSDEINTIYVIDVSGKVVASSDRSLLNHPFPYINQAFFSSFHPSSTRSFQVPNPKGNVFDGLLVPMRTPQNCSRISFTGYLAATTSYSVESSTLRNLFMMIGVVAIFMILLGSGVIFFLTGYMLRPLRAMAAASQAIAEGDLQQRVHLPQSEDEVGMLARSFNAMADRIERAFQVQQQSEQRAQRFVSDASHELRTPITSLRGFTEVLIRGAKDDPETTQRVLKLMKNEAERMTRLVNDLLTLARLDEGRSLQIQVVDLVDIAVEGVQQAKTLAGDICKVSLNLLTQERLKMQGDAERLKQMLLVLLENAIKYGCPGPDGKVVLILDKQNEHALLEVVDKGPGIAPEDLPHIFDRFYRGQHTPTSHTGGTPIAGTGLGLAIAIAIAHVHHGDITVSSTLNKKTVFTVTLPCLE
jgi:signal transduction histidine kinase